MTAVFKDYVVVGSSRGLGAALVQELLDQTSCRVHGIARTPLEQLRSGLRWAVTARYRHLQLDISLEGAAEEMARLADQCSGRLCVIYNAAHIEKDFLPEGRLDHEAFDRVNAAGIAGLRNTLAAFENSLLERGGAFVGVSSHWGRVTPVSLRYVAYPATKAYLDSLLRSLDYLWPPQISLISITIGNIKEQPGRLPTWFIPTYTMAAKVIVKRLTAARPPRRIDYPGWHAVLYQYVLRWLPEAMLPHIFGAYLRMESPSLASPHDSGRDEGDGAPGEVR